MMMMTEGTSVLAILGMLLMVIVAIAWILLPFAMFGMKPLLRELIDVTRESNELLRGIRDSSRSTDRQ